ncbi:hypothetical protein RN001_007916, partial [Aquatica leii]
VSCNKFNYFYFLRFLAENEVDKEPPDACALRYVRIMDFHIESLTVDAEGAWPEHPNMPFYSLSDDR